MAEYKSFSANGEVSGNILLTTFKVLPQHEKKIRKVFEKQGLVDLNKNQWYPLQAYLNCIRELAQSFGPSFLFRLGKYIPETIPQVKKAQNLKEALEALDEMYHRLHRGQNIGHYRLTEFNSESKEAQIECKNPYPCYLDRGILTTLSRSYKPRGARLINVELNAIKPHRLIGSDASSYNILWV